MLELKFGNLAVWGGGRALTFISPLHVEGVPRSLWG